MTNLAQISELKELVTSSDSILVTSHISPDPDALCSVLLIGTSLMANHPNKTITMIMEELTGDLNFLDGYEQIEQKPLVEAVVQSRPDLIVMADAMNFGRCTRGNIEAVRREVRQIGAKLAIIDHHEPEEIEPNATYINNHSPATTQDAYQIFIKDEVGKPDGYAQTALLGILSDTNRFMYDNPQHRQTFAVVSDLIEAGASIEQIVNQGARYTIDDMRVLSELAKNIKDERGYTYSFISDGFTENWLENSKTADDLRRGTGYFVNEFIRNIGANKWGFIVYKDIAASDTYSASFRSLSGIKDVSEIAKRLGGGGHKEAAGAKFKAFSIEEALQKVTRAISQN